MERERASPERLPPLRLRQLRELRVRRAAGDERPPYVSSASAVARRGQFAYVVGDEELDLAVFELGTDRPGELRRALAGELPDDPDERRRAKPDLEALTAMPPFEGMPYGGLLGLGSGSGPGRDRGFFWELGPDGGLVGAPRAIDLAPLYAALAERLGALNVEGAAVLGDRFALFHRGNDTGGESAIAELELDRVLGSLNSDRALEPGELLKLGSYELGELGGVRLAFSDAAALTPQLVVFTASAEAGDGTIEGSVVGTIDAEGRIRRLRTIDRRWKVEGVHASLDAGVIDLAFVCDQDDPGQPSPLLGGSMPAAEGLENGESPPP